MSKKRTNTPEKRPKSWQRHAFAWTWIGLAAFLLFGLASLVASLLLNLLGLGDTALSWLSWLAGAGAAGWLVWRWWQRPIPPHILSKQLPRTQAGGLTPHLQPADELWAWDASNRTWERIVGLRGKVIVRNGRPTRHYTTDTHP